MKNNEFFNSAKALLFFKPYTNFSRWFEIALGIFAWINLLYAVIGIIGIISILRNIWI